MQGVEGWDGCPATSVSHHNGCLTSMHCRAASVCHLSPLLEILSGELQLDHKHLFYDRTQQNQQLERSFFEGGGVVLYRYFKTTCQSSAGCRAAK